MNFDNAVIVFWGINQEVKCDCKNALITRNDFYRNSANELINSCKANTIKGCCSCLFDNLITITLVTCYSSQRVFSNSSCSSSTPMSGLMQLCYFLIDSKQSYDKLITMIKEWLSKRKLKSIEYTDDQTFDGYVNTVFKLNNIPIKVYSRTILWFKYSYKYNRSLNVRAFPLLRENLDPNLFSKGASHKPLTFTVLTTNCSVVHGLDTVASKTARHRLSESTQDRCYNLAMNCEFWIDTLKSTGAKVTDISLVPVNNNFEFIDAVICVNGIETLRSLLSQNITVISELFSSFMKNKVVFLCSSWIITSIQQSKLCPIAEYAIMYEEIKAITDECQQECINNSITTDHGLTALSCDPTHDSQKVTVDDSPSEISYTQVLEAGDAVNGSNSKKESLISSTLPEISQAITKATGSQLVLYFIVRILVKILQCTSRCVNSEENWHSTIFGLSESVTLQLDLVDPSEDVKVTLIDQQYSQMLKATFYFKYFSLHYWESYNDDFSNETNSELVHWKRFCSYLENVIKKAFAEHDSSNESFHQAISKMTRVIKNLSQASSTSLIQWLNKHNLLSLYSSYYCLSISNIGVDRVNVLSSLLNSVIHFLVCTAVHICQSDKRYSLSNEKCNEWRKLLNHFNYKSGNATGLPFSNSIPSQMTYSLSQAALPTLDCELYEIENELANLTFDSFLSTLMK